MKYKYPYLIPIVIMVIKKKINIMIEYYYTEKLNYSAIVLKHNLFIFDLIVCIYNINGETIGCDAKDNNLEFFY